MHGTSWSRRELLRSAAVLPLAAACGATSKESAPSPKARNVLVLLADDLSGKDLGCYGNGDVRTPRIDALANEGRRFERAYTAVGVCQPSRSSLYTGLYPIHHGALGFGPIRADVATWPELLRARGVATALIGKLDVDPLEKFPFDFLVKAKDMASRRDPALFEQHFREFLASCRGRPFAAVLAFSDPHRPFDEEASGEPSTDPARIGLPPSLWDTPGTRRELAQYYDCIARLDHSVARALSALEQDGRAEETLVIFTSDNGASFPFAKSTLYEAGVRMPLIARGPGVQLGTSGELVGLVDLLPTALELFGAPARELDGRSLLSAFAGAELGRKSLVTMQTDNNREQSAPSRALHTARFAYIRNFGQGQANVSNVVGHTETWESGKVLARTDPKVEARMTAYIYPPREELSDLERDPCELANLADDAAHAATRDAMRAEMRAWMAEQVDPQLAEWGE